MVRRQAHASAAVCRFWSFWSSALVGASGAAPRIGGARHDAGKAVTTVRNKQTKPKKGSGICTYGPASSVPLGVTLATKNTAFHDHLHSKIRARVCASVLRVGKMDGENPLRVRRAIVLYGRVGAFGQRAQSMHHSAHGDLRLWQQCAESTRQFVLMPWSANNGLVDIFVQSWNPGSMAHAMDAFWQPRLAQHADQNTSLRCPISMRLCERTMWAV